MNICYANMYTVRLDIEVFFKHPTLGSSEIPMLNMEEESMTTFDPNNVNSLLIAKFTELRQVFTDPNIYIRFSNIKYYVNDKFYGNVKITKPFTSLGVLNDN